MGVLQQAMSWTWQVWWDAALPRGHPARRSSTESVKSPLYTCGCQEDYKEVGQVALETAWELVNSKGWRLEKACKNGDAVFSKKSPTGKKIYLISGIIDAPPATLKEELFHGVDRMASWNSTVAEARIIEKIDHNVHVSYQVASSSRGLATRDFVTVRYMGVKDGVYVAAGQSVEHPDMPPSKNHVRGENGPGAWVIRPIPGDPNRCSLQWLLDTDIKGWVPQTLIDAVLGGILVNSLHCVRQLSDKLRQESDK